MVSKVLDEQRLATIRRGCAETIREMVARDPLSAGNRGSHRYTFGTAPAHFGKQQEWACLIDPPRTIAVLSAIFGSDDFHQTASASGGDFVLPGCCEYQHLHSCAAPPLPTSPSHLPSRTPEQPRYPFCSPASFRRQTPGADTKLFALSDSAMGFAMRCAACYAECWAPTHGRWHMDWL